MQDKADENPGHEDVDPCHLQSICARCLLHLLQPRLGTETRHVKAEN